MTNASIKDIEKALLQQSANAQLYAFTKTINSLPHDKAALLRRKVVLQIAKNIQHMPASNDAKIAVMNIYASKFGN